MWQISRSSLFIRKWQQYAVNYRQLAGTSTAEKFIDSLESAVKFVGQNPLSCPVYVPLSPSGEIKKHEYRKWKIPNFPFSIFFRIQKDRILLETIYAHKMNIDERMREELAEQ